MFFVSNCWQKYANSVIYARISLEKCAMYSFLCTFVVGKIDNYQLL